MEEAAVQKSRDELTRQVEKLEFVLEGAGMGSWDWNLEDNSVSFDPRWSRMLGLDPATTPQVLSTWETRVHPDDLANCYRDVQAHIDGRTPRYENIHRVRHADGHYVWILDRGKVTGRDAGGRALRFSGVHIDISRQKETEEQLREAKSEIERQVALNFHTSRMATVGEMAGGIAHEINSPLAIITTLAGQIEDLAGSPEFDAARLRSSAHRILVTSQRIARIITTVLGISRQTPNDPMIPCRLAGIVEDAFSVCQERFHLEGVRFEHKIMPDGLQILARPNEITQVILNLLQNARDAISQLPVRWVRLEAAQSNHKILIRMQDSGLPIPFEIRRHLFEPFFTTKPPSKGTGLGLHISRKIIEAHRGRIYLEPEAVNTCFVIELPAPAPN